MAERQVIQLSFKNDIREQELLNFLRSKISPTSFIKEVLWDIYNQRTPVNSYSNIVPIQSQEICLDLFNENSEREEIIWG